MDVEIYYRPSNTAAKIMMPAGDGCTTESGSMIAMTSNLSIETTTYKRGKGSILRSLKRLFAGESFFLNHYKSSGDSELWLSSGLPGDMITYHVQGTKLIVQAGSFVAADDDVDIDVGWQGFKNLISGESLFWLHLGGQGLTLLSAFGEIYEVDVDGDYIVDTSHIVAFEETLNFTISKAGGSWINSFLGGEGFTCHFKGKGKLFCQSHNPKDFGHALRPYLKPKRG